jgi:Bacterial membrane protein YfhO
MALLDSAIWLPLICYSVVRLHEERSGASVAIAAIAFAMPVLAGHPETAIHITLVGVGLALFLAVLRPSTEATRQPFRYLALLGVCGLFAMGVAAVQILPTLEWIPHLNRGSDSIWPPVPLRNVIGMVSRDILSSSNSFGLQIPEQAAYVGMIAFLGFPIAWLHAQRRYVVFFSLSTIVALCVAYGIRPIYTLSLYVPMLMGLKNSRFILVVSFGVAVLAGLGVSVLENLEKQERKRRIRAAMFAAGGICLAALMIYLVRANLVALPVGHSRYPKASLLFLSFSTIPVALRLAGLLRPRLFNFLLAGVVIVDVCSFSYGFMPFEKPQYILPEDKFFARISSKTSEPVRLMQIGDAYTANAEILYGIQSSGGYEIPLRRMAEFTRGVTLNYMDAILQDSEHVFDTADRRIDMLSTRYYVVQNKDPLYKRYQESPDRFRFLFEFAATSMFENLKAMPPAFLVPSSGITVIKDEKAQMESIRSAGFDPARTVILEEPLSLASTSGVPGNVHWIARKNSSLQLKVDSATDSVLVLSQTFYPGWKAFVDGKRTPVFPADYALTGIAVGAGSHDVVFTFDPLSFKIGLLLSAVMTLVVGTLLYRHRKHLKSGS